MSKSGKLQPYALTPERWAALLRAAGHSAVNGRFLRLEITPNDRGLCVQWFFPYMANSFFYLYRFPVSPDSRRPTVGSAMVFEHHGPGMIDDDTVTPGANLYLATVLLNSAPFETVACLATFMPTIEIEPASAVDPNDAKIEGEITALRREIRRKSRLEEVLEELKAEFVSKLKARSLDPEDEATQLASIDCLIADYREKLT